MKKNVLIFFIWIAVCSCLTAKEFEISGTWYDKESTTTVYLIRNNRTLDGDKEPDIIDSTKIINGQFFFSGSIDEPAFMASIKIDGRSRNFILEPGYIRLDWQKEAFITSGTPINDDYYSMYLRPWDERPKVPDSLMIKRIRAIAENTWTFDDEQKFMDYYNNLETPAQSKERFVNKMLFLSKYCDQLPVIEGFFTDSFTSIERNPIMKEIFETFPEIIQQSIIEKKNKFDAETMSSIAANPPLYSIQPFPSDIAEGAYFTDLMSTNPNGDRVWISDLMEGKKLVLWDFWASWCQPCIKEMPLIAELYDRYKDDGFTVIGISSDQNRDQWLAAIDKYDMVWTQLLSDGIVNHYEVKMIPHTILIDENGIIVARGLRGEKLAERIREIMEE